MGGGEVEATGKKIQTEGAGGKIKRKKGKDYLWEKEIGENYIKNGVERQQAHLFYGYKL